MRAALLAAAAVLATACSAGDTPTGSPSPAGPSTATSTSLPATSTTSGTMLSAWEPQINAISPRAKCPDTAMFQTDCAVAIVHFSQSARKLAQDADRRGSRYAQVEATATEVADAADRWVDKCVTTDPYTSERAACLPTWTRVLNGDEAILAAIHEVETP